MVNVALELRYSGRSIPVVVDQEACDKQAVHGVFSDNVGEGLLIRVAQPLSTPDHYWTLIHELLHAVSHCNGLALPEWKVLVLENALRDLLVNNPELVRGLIKE